MIPSRFEGVLVVYILLLEGVLVVGYVPGSRVAWFDLLLVRWSLLSPSSRASMVIRITIIPFLFSF